MPFPKTEAELKAAGYTFEGSSKCKKCPARILWWKTPKGKMMPLDLKTYEPHWGSCPARDEFKKKK